MSRHAAKTGAVATRRAAPTWATPRRYPVALALALTLGSGLVAAGCSGARGAALANELWLPSPPTPTGLPEGVSLAAEASESGLSAAPTATSDLAAVALAEAPTPGAPIHDVRKAMQVVANKTSAVRAKAPGVLLESVIGLLLLISLAWLMGHPKVREVEATLGIANMVATGFPFLILGLVARLPAVGVLDDALLARLSPVLDFGLGWLGLLVGMRFDLRILDRLPAGTASAVALRTAVPFAALTLLGGASLWLLQPELDFETAARNAVVIGAAGAMTAQLTGALAHGDEVAGAGPGDRRLLESFVAQLDEFAGIVGLALLASFFRPPGETAWQLPGTAWLFVLVGMGGVVGLLVYATVRRPTTGPEFLAVTIGSVAFSAGLSAYLRLPPLAVSFLIGTMLTNLPGDLRTRLAPILRRLERPLQLLFLAAVGASWDFGDWRGWALLPVFVAVRAVAAGAARRAAARTSDLVDATPRLWHLEPVGLMAIALVVSVQTLYAADSLRWLVSTVVGGAMLTELLWQIWPDRHPDAR